MQCTTKWYQCPKTICFVLAHLATLQGDGTAAIFQGRTDVFTLSVHAERNFPSRKQQSHLDVGLPDGTRDTEYLG